MRSQRMAVLRFGVNERDKVPSETVTSAVWVSIDLPSLRSSLKNWMPSTFTE